MYGVRHVGRAAVVAGFVAAGVMGCGEDRLSAKCMTTVTSVTSPASGALTLIGNFYHNESIIVRDEQTNTQVASGTPATDRTLFTFTDLTPGLHTFEIIASCDNGQEDVAAETVTIH